MARTLARRLLATVGLACSLGGAWASSAASAEEPKGHFEVHDLSFWILEAGGQQANMRTAYATALPAHVNTARSSQPPSHRRLTPINLITFYGPPASNLDIDLRTKAGTFLAHWPSAESLPNRLRWAGTPAVELVEKLKDETELSYADNDHWIRRARENQDALYIRRGARSERFLAYDVELSLPAPVRLEGGPDKYTVINTSDSPVYDVLVSRSTPKGRRLAWIDVLPPSKPVSTAKAADAANADGKGAKPQLFDDDKPAEMPQEPAKANPAKEKPAADAAKAAKLSPKLFGGIAAEAVAKAVANQNKTAPATKAAEKAKSDEKQPGDGAKPADKSSPAAPALAGLEVALGEPLAEGAEETKAKMAAALRERLAKAGLKSAEIELFLDNYQWLFFEGDAVVVACRLAGPTIDEKIPLSIFPEPAKTVRVAMVLMRNADPQLGSEVDRLIAQLGDSTFRVREAAQKRLTELGPLAFPALNKALNQTDQEVVIRCERILLSQNQTPNPKATSTTGKAVPAAAVRIAK